MRVVAGSIGGQYTTVEVRNPETVSPEAYGDFAIECLTDYPAYLTGQRISYIEFDFGSPGGGPDPRYHSPTLAFQWLPVNYDWTSDDGAGTFQQFGGWPTDELAPFEDPAKAQFDSDIYLRSVQNVDHASVHRLGFRSQWGGVKATVTGKSPDVFFHELRKQDVIDDWADKFHPGVTDESHPYPGDVYVFRTTGGLYGKLLIQNTYFWIWERFLLFWPQRTRFRIEGQFVIFRQ
jgi:hypothetical protein